jgi:hypothetical protein
VTAPDPGLERVRLLFRQFAARQCPGRSVVYERLALGVADDDGLLRLVLAAPPEQQRPSLLLAAVNLLLASEPAAALSAYYPSHGGWRSPDDGLWPSFTAFCAEHEAELASLLRERTTQTNEIRRCLALRLGLSRVSQHWPGPLALVEAGASAGLNLLFDQYAYRLGPGPAQGPVVISTELVGDTQCALGPPPEITSRLGLDLAPISLADPAARAWLEAFVWPEQPQDLATLRAAIDLALTGSIPTVTKADAVTDTARLISALPGHEPVVVFTASLLSYVAAPERADFSFRLDEVARHRPVAWIFAEAPGLLAAADITAPALTGPLARRNSRYVIGISLRSPGGPREDELLALADPYLRWLAPARSRDDDFAWVQAG